MSAFIIEHKQALITQSFAVVNAYRGDASAAPMVSHHQALISKLQAEIVELKQVLAVGAFGAAVVVSTGCRGEWMVVAGGLDAFGRVAPGSRIGGITAKRTAERLAKRVNKEAQIKA
ncbi:MAG: hypothetical protein ACRDDI_13480 [Aeromonas veronii]